MNGDHMESKGSHLSDQDLLRLVDGELSAGERSRAASHLTECWDCRTRKQDLEATIGQFVRLHRSVFDPVLPPASVPRAALQARMARESKPRWAMPFARLQVIGGVALLLVAIVALSSMPALRHAARNVPVSFPEPSLTPGAITAATRDQVCSASAPKNREVPRSLQRRVFEEYGLVSAESRAYEVDYLITPALGGADDIRNLWPQSYGLAVWNAHVKDALEDRMRDLVCEGTLDLASAQREISSDWIAAYKKYFHTERPLH